MSWTGVAYRCHSVCLCALHHFCGCVTRLAHFHCHPPTIYWDRSSITATLMKEEKKQEEKKTMSLHLLIFSIFRCFLTLLLPSGARETPNYLQVKITTNLSAFLSHALALFAL